MQSKANKSLAFVFFRIAVLATAISVIVMIWSVGILDGFKNAITNKLVGIGSHIVVSKHVTNYSYSTSPIPKEQEIIDQIKNVKGVTNVQTYAIKAGLIKTNDETFGVVLKGIDENFNWKYFDQYMIKGRKLIVSQGNETGKEVVISESLSQKAKVDTGQFLYMYFLDQTPRMRKYQVVGIYNTNLEDLDMIYVLADIHDVQRLNDWKYFSDQQISGYEVTIDNMKNLDKISEEITRKVGFRFDINGEKLKVETLRDLYPAIFDWMSLLNINSTVLLFIMAVIASMNMITSLLILILDKTQTIAILKVVGSNNWSIRKVFIYNGIQILLKGLLWGNVIGIVFGLLQNWLHFLPLDPKMYYINYVPIELNILKILAINVALVILTFFVLIVPSYIISKLSPAKALKFD